MPTTYPIATTEQTTNDVIVFDQEGDWADASSVVWRWSAPGGSGTPWYNLSDVRLRSTKAYGSVVLVAASGGRTAMLRKSTRQILWQVSTPEDNPHAIERLPGGVIVTASTKPGRLRFYADSTHTKPFRTVGLALAHGVLYDPARKALWAIGDKQLIRYSLSGKGAGTKLAVHSRVTFKGVLRTEDGGVTWTETFRNTDPKAFYDCVTFFDDKHGLAVSDPVDGKYRMLSTRDGGLSWAVLPSDGMPAALDGEASFAASGQCLVGSGGHDVWLATGGGATARVLHSGDRGLTWTAAGTTVPAGDSAKGVFALAFRDGWHGIAVGGDYRADQASPDAAAVSRDGGATWTASAQPPPAYRSGVSWLPYAPSSAVAVGPTGSDLSTDGGRTWRTFDTGSYDTVRCAADGGCWASGEQRGWVFPRRRPLHVPGAGRRVADRHRSLQRPGTGTGYLSPGVSVDAIDLLA
ncbi:DUF6528 family protein [Actinacidiphila soli]|uniref:DUF6528 family protein n=1 Tax=Actinacidiphila soli TaxID=2487275 RepID=UPI001F0C4A3F|nr:DUF6528 family protein [Actinacidiphila soli]